MITTRSTRLSQPQGSVEIDYANPLAKGVAWLYLPSVEKELVRSLPITKGSGYTRRSVAGGVGQVLDANSTITTPSASLNSSDTLTMFSVASVKASLVSQAAIIPHAGVGNGSAGSTVVGQTAYAGGGGAGAVVYYSPNYSGYIIASSPGGDFTPGNVVVIVATYRRKDALRVYANGNLRATTAAADYQANLKFNSTVNVGGTSVSSTNVLMSGISYRAWSDAEIVEFSANPWQLFKPDSRRIYFDMGAGGTTEVTTEGTNSVQLSTSDSGYIGQEHLLVSSSSTQLGTLTAMGIAQANTLSSTPLVQTITSVGGAVTQISILSGEATASSSGTSPGAVQQVNKLLGSACLSLSSASSAGMLQVSNLTAISNAQLLLTTAAGILQSHVLLGGATFQSSYATSGGMSLTPLIELSADVVQAQSFSGAGQVSQDHKLSHGQSEQPATSSNGATVQTHVLVSSNAVQFVLSSSEAIAVEEQGLLQGSSVSQGNTITLGVILQGNILRGTSARQLTLSSSGAITQAGVLPPLTDAELREILAGMQLAIARLQVRLDAMY